MRFDPVRAKAEGRDTGLPTEIADLFPDRFEESEIGEVPKGWTPQPLSDWLSPRMERQGSRALPEFSATVRGIEPRSARFKKTLSASSDKNKVAYKNDLVFGLSRTELNFGVLADDCGAFSPVYEIFQPLSEHRRGSILAHYIRRRMDYFMDILRPAAREGQSVDRTHLLSKRAPSFPSRVVKGMRMGGHMGADRVTVRNLKVVRVDADNNLLLVEGAVPGAPTAYLTVRKALKAKRLKVAQVDVRIGAGDPDRRWHRH